ncbi:MAG: hypothetical protein JWP20_1402 [Roseomonas sp.]|jgi:hypothetical protein|nr:hypothetical protein [Roseomonas sp.]
MQVQARKDLKTMTRYGRPASVEEQALDQWAQRMLKGQYDRAANEPVPEDLLALVRQFPDH